MEKYVVILNDGNEMPVVGLGTFQGNYSYTSVKDAVVASVSSAIDIGYRHFDTAFLYDTEVGLGEAIKAKIEQGVVRREELFITTKLWCTYHKFENVEKCIRLSLKSLQLSYADLILIHWPMSMPFGTENFPKDENRKVIFDDVFYTETWKGLEHCKALGLCKSIGISNFNSRQLNVLLGSCSVAPSCHQIEAHPFNIDLEVIDLCMKHNIAVSCYSPLGKPSRPWKHSDDPSIFTNEVISTIANRHCKTNAQICLKYLTQLGLLVIPKSNTPSRQRENIQLFDFKLSCSEMDELKSLNSGFRVLQLDFLKHSKEYPF